MSPHPVVDAQDLSCVSNDVTVYVILAAAPCWPCRPSPIGSVVSVFSTIAMQSIPIYLAVFDRIEKRWSMHVGLCACLCNSCGLKTIR